VRAEGVVPLATKAAGRDEGAFTYKMPEDNKPSRLIYSTFSCT
jgi:hypothetical protein